VHGSQLLTFLLDQLRSPLIGLLAVGAGLSLIFGAIGDVAIIASTIAISVAMSAWQEQKANQVANALQRMGVSYARVLRDNQTVTIPANEVVPGDILLLASGDRIAADARVISSQGLEVDEAALTGESLPVSKVPSGKNDINHIVLEGSDVTSGTGRAIVVAVGQQTRMGATRAALAENGTEPSPLGVRLSRMLRLLIPLSIAGGVTVVIAGLFWGQPLTSLLALGVTVTLAAVPEGLPLLAKVGEAGVARRRADQQAGVSRR
jgi:P-type E1-E2 ATPase